MKHKVKVSRKSNILMILILIVSLGVGVIGSYTLVLVKTSQAWLIMCLVAMAVIDGFLVGTWKRQ